MAKAYATGKVIFQGSLSSFEHVEINIMFGTHWPIHQKYDLYLK